MQMELKRTIYLRTKIRECLHYAIDEIGNQFHTVPLANRKSGRREFQREHVKWISNAIDDML